MAMSILTKLGIAAMAALVALGALYGYGKHRYNQGVTDTTNAAKVAAAAQYKADVDRINKSNTLLQAKLTELQNAGPKIVTKYKEVMVKAPLPAACRIDTGRLSSIAAAIDASNASRKP